MLVGHRKIILVLACLVPAMSGCGSSNADGKLVGRWKITTLALTNPKGKEAFEAQIKSGAYGYLDFKADNTFVFGLTADNNQTIGQLKLNYPGDKIAWEGRYTLLPGETVEIHDLTAEEPKQFFKGDRVKVKIRIDGDNMTLTDTAGANSTLTKVKAPDHPETKNDPKTTTPKKK